MQRLCLKAVSVCIGVMLGGLVVLATAPAAHAEDPPQVPQADATSTPPVETSTVPPLYRVEDDRSALRFSGRWRYINHVRSSGLSQRYSSAAGATVSIAFTGTGISVIGQLGPNHGKARIYLDGAATSTVSLYAPTHVNQQRILHLSGLPDGRHTLKLQVMGTREASSTGTYVHVDAFDIEGKVAALGTVPGVRVQNGDARLYRKGSWSTVKYSGAYGGSYARTTSKGAATTIRFTGTDVIWFGRKSASGGKSEVWLDGKRVAIVSQYATATASKRVVWAATGLTNATHDVLIKSLGQADTGGTGARIDLDAFQIRGTVGTALRPTPFSYPWKTYIVIDKSSFKLYWVKNKMLVKTYSIAHGKAETPTPEKIWRIDAKYHTSPGSVYGPRKMRMFKRVSTSSGYRYVFTAYAIHGTNQEWVIGTRASHGCIRMYNKEVLELFPQVPLGTMVVTRQ
jgi:lipoprotein-anchoring transpeptidase ErfK/SrfK